MADAVISGGALTERWRRTLTGLLRSGPLPRPSRWMWAADTIVAAVLSAAVVLATVRRGDGPVRPALVVGPAWDPVVPAPPVPAVPPDLPPVPAWLLLLAALTAAPLAARRRFPLAAFWAVTGLTLLYNQHADGAEDATVYTFLACVIAAYSAAVYSPRRLPALGSLVAGAALTAVFHDENFPSFTPGAVPFVLLLGVGLAANAIHTAEQRLHALKERQESATRLAVDRERARIARELHDIVTHNVSVMVIQAGAARKVMDAAPDRAREALLAVEAGGRTALAELRHVMGLLTMTADAAPSDGGPLPEPGLAPQPGLDRLPELTDRVRATGVPLGLTVTGTPAPLPAGADLAAYRVVQEALTNVVRHAAGARVRVAVDHAPDAVRIEVTDTGGTATAPPGSGRGLTGLGERLDVYGGTLETARLPEGGFQVRAVLPVDGHSPPAEAPRDTGTHGPGTCEAPA
ncbi:MULTISPECIES: sensor histidine kinase [Streptomyces]|nr:histidine kinase [Streptomyces actuosus]